MPEVHVYLVEGRTYLAECRSALAEGLTDERSSAA
jgi:hypothetical protein